MRRLVRVREPQAWISRVPAQADGLGLAPAPAAAPDGDPVAARSIGPISSTGIGKKVVVFRSDAAVPPQPMRRAAAKIAEILDVPVVTCGHTHDEVLWRLPRSGESGSAWRSRPPVSSSRSRCR